MMPARLDALTARFTALRVAVVGDFSLDRYFDVDPARTETSLETGRPVHNLARIRCSPGAAGNVGQNLGALGAGALWLLGGCGDDGEGFELLRALRRVPGARLDHFIQSPQLATFSYTKPLLPTPGGPPTELSRFDLKPWAPAPAAVERRVCAALTELAPQLDALVVLEQSAARGAGLITRAVLETVERLATTRPALVVLADSRHGLAHFPPLGFKMNAAEYAALTGRRADDRLAELQAGAAHLSAQTQRPVFITLAERGIVGALPGQPAQHSPALPLRGPIDIVGAGDTVTATLALALAAGATLAETLHLSQAAASVVIHQVGTTGTASPPALRALLFAEGQPAHPSGHGR